MKYNEIIKLNHELDGVLKEEEYKVVILSNIMVHQSKEICEYLLRAESVNASVSIGEYDNIVQDSAKAQDANAVLIFWEMCNFIDGLQYKVNTLSETELQSLVEKIKLEIDLVFNNLKNTPLVLINKFSSLIFDQFSLNISRANKLTNELNFYLKNSIGENFKIIDIDKVMSRLSIDLSVDLRYYYLSKTLYSIEFYKQYFEYVKPIFLSIAGKIKKALIFDCDNTLWKGVLGEDGFDNIKIYQEIQYLALDLANRGVIIGLCSKNNPEDIDKVLEKHPDMIIRDSDIVIKEVNWNNKASNLKSIAKSLNIGIDSLVFIDDSSFETDLIKKELPEVTVFQVPKKQFKYGMMVRKLNNLFYNPSETKEDGRRVKIYKEQLQRTKSEESIGSIEDYLATLDLMLKVYIDDITQAARISQMTQKTNQFNLTTKRYTEGEIIALIKKESSTVISINVQDKYGDHGLTGLAILDNTQSIIDTLLLSCRVLGRNIEYQFMDVIVDIAKRNKLVELSAAYIKTNKNHQVVDFYEKCGFMKLNESDKGFQYNLQVDSYNYQDVQYIEVENGR